MFSLVSAFQNSAEYCMITNLELSWNASWLAKSYTEKNNLPSVEIHASPWKSQGNFTGPHGFSWVFHGFSTGWENTGYCGLSFKLNPALNHFDQDKFDPRTPQQRFNRLFFFRIIEPKNPACSVVTHNSVLWCQGLCGESNSYRIWLVIRICLRVLGAIKKVENNE